MKYVSFEDYLILLYCLLVIIFIFCVIILFQVLSNNSSTKEIKGIFCIRLILNILSIFLYIPLTELFLLPLHCKDGNIAVLSESIQCGKDLYYLYVVLGIIGALLTFERKDKEKDIIKNGSKIDAPVTFEILVTIFYPGTRLHDGAVVICGNKIVAASVYYTPTTKPLTGKYGSRHRAALGISEISDAVTVVVSEETGRISIAYNGILESYSPDNFYKAFENIMNETDMPAE